MAEKDDDDAVAAAIMHSYSLQIVTKIRKNVIEMFIYRFCIVYKHTKRKL